MAISELPTPPSRNDSESVFVDRANNFLGALPTFRTEANALGDAVEADKVAAAASVTAALGHANAAAASSVTASGFADDAQASVALSQAAANFKGLWSALTGALSKPATVFYSGGYWALNTDLADVTAKEPGVDVEWTAISVGVDYQEFTTSGTWTKPAGVSVVYVEAIGGGASGDVRIDTGTIGLNGGGAGGSYGFARFDADALGATAAVVVGAGGAPTSRTSSGAVGGAGSVGGDSTFDDLAIGRGGAGNGVSLWGAFFGGTGGTTGTGGASLAGGGGGGGIRTSGVGEAGGVSTMAGNGGDSVRSVDADATGQAGAAPGGGGGGASCQSITDTRTATSGAGGDGRVRVWAW